MPGPHKSSAKPLILLITVEVERRSWALKLNPLAFNPCLSLREILLCFLSLLHEHISMKGEGISLEQNK